MIISWFVRYIIVKINQLKRLLVLYYKRRCVKITALEKYIDEVDDLIDRLDNMSFGFTDEVAAAKLMAEASQKLKEMMSIIIDVGIANGVMAEKKEK